MDVVARLWGFCNTLRHDGINYGDYIEQLTYLLFLKLADEKDLALPAGYGWGDLRRRSGTDLLDYYTDTLRTLGRQSGLLGAIFSGSIAQFREPVNLKKLINLIDDTEWGTLDVDLKGAAYEGLLQKYAAEQKGAGQYFTPRPVIRAIVRCLQPGIREDRAFRVHDPACGTGGFLIGAAEWMLNNAGSLSREDQERLQKRTFSGTEIVLETRRLALMNLYLHDIESDIHYGDAIAEGGKAEQYSVVLTNPPFGTKGAGEVPNRDDFTISTANKQLNFVQHVLTTLKRGGRAAMVLPDNVLFEEHAGREVRKLLLEETQLHTILRLPVGTFAPYSTGVKANVIFFRKGLSTAETWIYDGRTNVPTVNKGQPLTEESLRDFVESYGPEATPKPGTRQETDRFHRFTRADIEKRDWNLDIFWLRDSSLDNPENAIEPEDALADLRSRLQTALDAIAEMEALLTSEAEPVGVA